MSKTRLVLTVLLSAAATAHAHGAPDDATATSSPLERAAHAWTFDPWLIGGLALAASLYVIGARRLRARAEVLGPRRRRAALAFTLGWLTLAVALLSPLDALSDLLFSAHMSQHELLMLVAAPLLVYAEPLRTYLWALPRSARARVLRVVTARPWVRTFQWLTGPVLTLVLHGIIRWAFHLPGLFEAALRSEWVHGVQHAMFFASAALFWWALVHGRYGRLGYGVSVLFVFATTLHTGALGAFFAFARAPLYPLYVRRAHEARVDALADQALAGLIMWVGAGVLLTLLGLALCFAWLGEAHRRAARGTVAALLEAQRRERGVRS